MPRPFAAALAAADLVLDRHLGETVTIVPMVRADFADAIDATRPQIECVALIGYVAPAPADIATLDVRAVHEQLVAEIRRAALPEGAAIRKGDHVRLDDRPGTPLAKVANVQNSDPGRVVLDLAPLGYEAGA